MKTITIRGRLTSVGGVLGDTTIHLAQTIPGRDPKRFLVSGLSKADVHGLTIGTLYSVTIAEIPSND